VEVCADLHLRPYYGDEDDTDGLYHSVAKRGTTAFHAYVRIPNPTLKRRIGRESDRRAARWASAAISPPRMIVLMTRTMTMTVVVTFGIIVLDGVRWVPPPA